MKNRLKRAEFESDLLRDNHVTVPNLVTLPLPKSFVTVKYRSVDETRDLIMRVMSSAIAPLPRSLIAKLIGRKKTPGFHRTLDGLVSEGQLRRYTVTRANHAEMYLYEMVR